MFLKDEQICSAVYNIQITMFETILRHDSSGNVPVFLFCGKLHTFAETKQTCLSILPFCINNNYFLKKSSHAFSILDSNRVDSSSAFAVRVTHKLVFFQTSADLQVDRIFRHI